MLRIRRSSAAVPIPMRRERAGGTRIRGCRRRSRCRGCGRTSSGRMSRRLMRGMGTGIWFARANRWKRIGRLWLRCFWGDLGLDRVPVPAMRHFLWGFLGPVPAWGRGCPSDTKYRKPGAGPPLGVFNWGLYDFLLGARPRCGFCWSLRELIKRGCPARG